MAQLKAIVAQLKQAQAELAAQQTQLASQQAQLTQVEAQLDSWRQKTMVRDSSDEGAPAADLIDTSGLVVPREPPIPQKIGRL